MGLTAQRNIFKKFRAPLRGPRTPENTPKRLPGLIRWSVALIFPLFLVSCAAIESAIQVKLKRASTENKSSGNPNMQVVLKAVPRHLLAVPREEFVWLWNKPGGMQERAMRVKKVPSGTVGRVLEFEPEPSRHAAWAADGLENHLRAPIRWVKVVTFHGLGWVRTEFIDPR